MAEKKSPARSRKTPTSAADASDESLIPEAPAPDQAPADAGPGADTVDAIPDAVIVSDDPAPSEAPGDDTTAPQATDAVDTPEPDVSAPPPPLTEKVVEHVIEKRGGVLPMILAGALVAAAGFAAGASDLLPLRASPPPDLSGDVAALADRVGKVETGLGSAAAPQGPDLGPLTARLDKIETTLADLATRQGALDDRLAALDSRIGDIALSPVSEDTSKAVAAAVEAELSGLRAAVAAEREEVEQMLASAREIEANAAGQARQAEAKAAIARLVAGIDRGDDLQAELTALGGLGVTVPDALAEAARGVATLSALQADFPDAARAALAEARTSDGAEGGVATWLQRQLGARSVTPRDGGDADAILSRAEAALTQGQLDRALQEIDALPDAAKAPLADWQAAAAARLAATQAVDAMAAELTSN